MARPKRGVVNEPEIQRPQKISKGAGPKDTAAVENGPPPNGSRKRRIAAVAPLPQQEVTSRRGRNAKQEQKGLHVQEDDENETVAAKRSRETLKKRRSKDNKRVGKKGRTVNVEKKEIKEPEYCLSVPTLPVLREGEVLSVGTGDTGQLGLGSDVMEKSRFFQVPGINEVVVDIAAGGMHSALLTASGKVLTFGCNDDGTLGRVTEEEEESFVPGVVDLPEKIVKISAGDSHTAALSEQGHVYIWGNFRDGSGLMGLTSRGEKEPLPIRIMESMPCASLASGAEHLVCLGLDGQIYTLGNGEQGQLGRVSQYFNSRGGRKGLDHFLKPDVVHFKRGKAFTKFPPEFDQIWAGAYCTYVRERSSSTIYGFGLNNYKQLGAEELMLFMPTALKILEGKKWEILSGGMHHVLALDSEGNVYAWGRKDYGRLGLGSIEADQTEPVLIPHLKEVKCRHVACGTTTSFAVSEEGKLYSWGFGSNNQLAHGGDDDEEIPKIVDSKSMQSRTVLCAMGGGQHTLVLATKKQETT